MAHNNSVAEWPENLDPSAVTSAGAQRVSLAQRSQAVVTAEELLSTFVPMRPLYPTA